MWGCDTNIKSMLTLKHCVDAVESDLLMLLIYILWETNSHVSHLSGLFVISSSHR